MDKIWNAVADGISQCVLDDKGNPRLPIKPSLTQYVEQAFINTAPVWLKPTLVFKSLLRKFAEKLKRSDKQKTTLALQEMVLTPKKLSDSFRVVRTWPEGNRPTDSEFDAASKKIINDINNKIIFLSDFADNPNLNKEENKEEHEEKKQQIENFKNELQKACDAVWKSISKSDKIKLFLSSVILLIALLGAVIAIPMDGGITSIEVLFHASIQELIAATAIGGTGGFLIQSHLLMNLLNINIFLPYASDFYAISCDTLNIPRPPKDKLPKLQKQTSDDKKNYPTYPLQDSKISTEKSDISDWVYWLELNDNLNQIKSSLNALDARQ
ncbi:MAG: hypothetical protein RKO25_00160 [Candidatus Contendobacter sp.]|nr:hypothetical protein [Candidatus Contendobacter sp.]